jgi:hypothetical protein
MISSGNNGERVDEAVIDIGDYRSFYLRLFSDVRNIVLHSLFHHSFSFL